MYAIISKPYMDGTYPETGQMDNHYFTTKYKTIRGLLRYGIPKCDGKVRIEIYWTRSSLYLNKPADKIMYI